MIDPKRLRKNPYAWIAAILLAAGVVAFGVVNLPPEFTPLSTLSARASELRLHGNRSAALRLYLIISARASAIDYSSNYELGNIYVEIGNYRAAKYYYRRAANNPSAPASVYYALSDLYLKHLSKQAGEFTVFMEKLLQANKKGDENVYLVLAEFYQQIGNHDQAIHWLQQGLTALPQSTALAAALHQLEAIQP